MIRELRDGSERTELDRVGLIEIVGRSSLHRLLAYGDIVSKIGNQMGRSRGSETEEAEIQGVLRTCLTTPACFSPLSSLPRLLESLGNAASPGSVSFCFVLIRRACDRMPLMLSTLGSAM